MNHQGLIIRSLEQHQPVVIDGVSTHCSCTAQTVDDPEVPEGWERAQAMHQQARLHAAGID